MHYHKPHGWQFSHLHGIVRNCSVIFYDNHRMDIACFYWFKYYCQWSHGASHTHTTRSTDYNYHCFIYALNAQNDRPGLSWSCFLPIAWIALRLLAHTMPISSPWWYTLPHRHSAKRCNLARAVRLFNNPGRYLWYRFCVVPRNGNEQYRRTTQCEIPRPRARVETND